ncbi:hypothetical protein [Tellurirhabdus rosea]|uniref:hypothetical protein n=1 Tax=Tellurirhabdus rosea TaxID=2674997 RepID=UPI002255A458|nr:hypothetical protein [Tellurirhabdus rosea]
MFKRILTLLVGVHLAGAAVAQQFLPPIDRFSSSKPGYLITKSGERVEFTLEDLDRKKGLIVRVEGKTTDGKKFKYEADEIAELGLAPSDFSKLNSLAESTRSIDKMQRNKVGESMRDLVVFYQEQLDDPKRTVLVQLINPGFDSRIRVYHDPFAMETMGVGVAGIQVTGGHDMSYYVKADGKVFRLKKKHYDDRFRDLFGSCPALMTKYKSFVWRDLVDHVYFFDQQCGEVSAR